LILFICQIFFEGSIRKDLLDPQIEIPEIDVFFFKSTNRSVDEEMRIQRGERDK
jgi:hypothetical protein